jgi:hypothetical protein
MTAVTADVRFIEKFLEMIRGVKTSLKMYWAELPCLLFDDPAVIQTLEDLSEEDVDVKISCGPVILRIGEEYSPRIRRLVKNGVIRLYAREKRGSWGNFVILDDTSVKIQDKHKTNEWNEISINEYVDRFMEYSSEFRRSETNRILSPLEENFLVLYDSDMQDLARIINAKKLDYDNLTREDISGLLKETLENEVIAAETFSRALSPESSGAFGAT